MVTRKAISLSKADPGGKEEITLAGTMVVDIAVKSMTIVQVQAKKKRGRVWFYLQEGDPGTKERKFREKRWGRAWFYLQEKVIRG